MGNSEKINLDALGGVGLLVCMYIFGVVIGYLNGYRLGQADERQDCIDEICLNSSYLEDGTITDFYVNIDPIPGE